MKKRLLDTSGELLAQWKNGGIVLTRPDKKHSHAGAFSSVSVAEILKLPLNVSFLDTNSVIQNINEQTIKTTGFTSINDALGKTVQVAAKREVAEQLMKNDQKTLTENRLVVKEDHYARLIDDVDFQAITFKTPWYDQENKILGLFFCSITLGLPESLPLTNALTLMFSLGLFNGGSLVNNQLHNATGLNIGNTYLSSRESQCLYYLTRGKTIKEMAKILDLSPRTVGHYLENIKAKLSITSKSQLIEKALPYFPLN